VAWMRMMGADSVAYHQATVMGRADDFPGQALAYYASRGETPLVWGGAGAARLGLAGRVTEEQYAAIYGPGGAQHPTTGDHLAATRRPGMELVVSAHKSVAELGSSAEPRTCTGSWTQSGTPRWPTWRQSRWSGAAAGAVWPSRRRRAACARARVGEEPGRSGKAGARDRCGPH